MSYDTDVVRPGSRGTGQILSRGIHDADNPSVPHHGQVGFDREQRKRCSSGKISQTDGQTRIQVRPSVGIRVYVWFHFDFLIFRVEIEHIHGQVEENPYLAATAVPRTPQPPPETKPRPTASDSDSSS